MIKRVVLIVLDSLGVGALPDADKYMNADKNDSGTDTLGHIVDNCPNLSVPNLRKLGFFNIDGAAGGRFAVDNDKAAGGPVGAFGRMAEMSAGKDTTTGHWEIAGIYTDVPFKTYPDGFPKKFIKKYEDAIGTEILGNCAASGTEIIEIFGDEHESTGKPIVYTSADSVFQIAANTDVIPLDRLYEICEIARKMLVGDMACGRVIARPYIKEKNKHIRTSDRRDYSVSPPEPTLLDKINEAGKTVYAVGKICDIFNGVGITASVHTTDNQDGVDKTIEAMRQDFEGLIFTNLVDFDSKYGHRRDPIGYGKCIEEFDRRLPDIIEAMRKSDVLMLCADHGNDPTQAGWDHTREYIPFTAYGADICAGVNLGTRSTFADIGATIAGMLDIESTSIGTDFCIEILRPYIAAR